jgi:hypothetical protein
VQVIVSLVLSLFLLGHKLSNVLTIVRLNIRQKEVQQILDIIRTGVGELERNVSDIPAASGVLLESARQRANSIRFYAKHWDHASVSTAAAAAAPITMFGRSRAFSSPVVPQTRATSRSLT